MNRLKKSVAVLLTIASLLLLLTACGNKNERTVGFCGEYEILYEELRFEALNYLQSNPDCSEEELWEAVEQALLERYAILELCKEFTPAASIYSQEAMEMAESEQKKAVKDLGGKDEFESSLEELYLTENLFQKLLIITQMQIDMETVLFANTQLKNKDALLTWLKDGNCIRARKITFLDIETAQAARNALNNGKTIEDLKQTDLLDNSYVGQPDYYFRNLNKTAEESAALSLNQEGAISEIIDYNGSYCLLIREKDNFENLENYQIQTALERYREDQLTPLIQEKIAMLTVSWNEFGGELVLKELT